MIAVGCLVQWFEIEDEGVETHNSKAALESGRIANIRVLVKRTSGLAIGSTAISSIEVHILKLRSNRGYLSVIGIDHSDIRRRLSIRICPVRPVPFHPHEREHTLRKCAHVDVKMRLRLPVGVAYGSDVPLVVETILTCAREQKDVAKSPAPEVLFMNFGDSSLNFELRVWTQDIDKMMQVRSALYHEIERKFRELNIVIPFPQRDVHFSSYDHTAGLIKTPGYAEGQEDI